MKLVEQCTEWFAIRVRSNFEVTAATILRGKGYEEFLPTYRSRTARADGTKEVRRPLFPGYVFCRMDIQRRLPVLTTPGVVYVVGVGRTPTPVTEQEIEAVRAIINSRLVASPCPFVNIGDEVEIVRGPLTGVRGILTRFKNDYRLVVSVTLLQRSVAVEIDGDWARRVRTPLPHVVAGSGRPAGTPEVRPALVAHAARGSLKIA